MTVAAAGSSASRTPLRVPVFVLLGAVVGVVAVLAAAVGPSWAVFLAHYGAGYVLLIVLIGVFAPSPSVAALRAVVCFVPFVVVYYGAVQIRFGAIPMLYAAAWLAAALVVCPAAALVVRWSRDRSAPVRAIIAACASAGVLADGTVRNAVLWLFGRFQGWELDPTFAAIDLVIVAVIILIVPRTARGRLIAVILTLLFGFVATTLGLAAHYGPGPYR